MVTYSRPITRRIAAALLAAILCLALSVPAMAQEPTPDPTEVAEPEEEDRQGIVGTVTAISEDGGIVTITKKNGTEYQVNVADLGLEVAVGDRVGILAQVGEEGQPLTAVRALKVPNKPMQEHVTGTVVERTHNTITIVDADGNERTIKVHPKADLSAETGEVITIVVGPGRSATSPGKLRKAADEATTQGVEGTAEGGEAAGEGEEGELTVTDALTVEKLGQRMANHAKTMRELADAGLTSEERAEARIDALNAKLDRISKHVDKILAKALEKVKNPRAKEAIEKARGKARSNLKSAKDDVEKHKKGKKPDDKGKPGDKAKPDNKGNPNDASGQGGESANKGGGNENKGGGSKGGGGGSSGGGSGGKGGGGGKGGK